MSEDFSPPPFGKAETRRGLDVRFQVQAKDSSAGWAAKDISDARWVYRIRAKSAVTTYVVNEVLTKNSDEQTSGWLDHYLALGSTAYPTLSWEITEVDSNVADTATPTGSRERVLIRWKQPIEDVPA